MKIRRLKINWEELEEAFNRKKHDLVSYLDRVTGHIVMEGEGEDDDADSDEAGYGAGQSHAAPVQRKDSATRLYIRPPGTARKIEWLKVFLDQEEDLDDQVKNQLWNALNTGEPAETLTEIFRQNLEEREAWYVYRADRVREMIDEWLAADGIEPVEPPPWRH